MTVPIALALGSNLGDRLNHLQRAIDALGQYVALDAIAPVYSTSPWGIEDQPDFLNTCLTGQTRLEPLDLLEALKQIERRLGRTPGPRFGPRQIDIDILFYGREVLTSERLEVPHPLLEERAFALAPLADIASDWTHPLSKRSVAEMLKRVDSQTVERLEEQAFRLVRPSRLAWRVRTYVMGIINVTPDSFSGDGLHNREAWLAAAVEQARAFAAEGADILDVGGQSTRPGSLPVSEQEESLRVIPAVEAIRAVVDLPISVDTYRAKVAQEALASGANWVNDVWGLRMDADMAAVVARAGCPVVIMHNRSQPKNVAQQAQLGGRYVGISYNDLFGDIQAELQASVDAGLAAGMQPEQIIVDPGIGFGKTVSQNRQLLAGLSELRRLGYPILIGPSRKSFIGYTLNLPPEERLEGTAAAVAIGIDRGADIIRVHDVKQMVRVARMADSIVRA